MRIALDFTNHRLYAMRERDDEKYYSESRLLHHIKRALIAAGYEVITKRMHKDGHLYGNANTPYIRSRHVHTPGAFMVYDGDYALRSLYADWNRHGEVTLLLTRCAEE